MDKKTIVSFLQVDGILIRMERCQMLLQELYGGANGAVHEDAVAAAADLLAGICKDFEAIINEACADRREGDGNDR